MKHEKLTVVPLLIVSLWLLSILHKRPQAFTSSQAEAIEFVCEWCWLVGICWNGVCFKLLIL